MFVGFALVSVAALDGSALAATPQVNVPVATAIGELRIDGARNDFSIITHLFVSADGTIVAAEPQDHRFRFFSPDGQQIAMAGRPGQGPGEFESLSILHAGWSADTFWVYPHLSRRVTFFTARGRFVRTAMLPAVPERPAEHDARTWPSRFLEPRGIAPDGTMLLTAVVPERAADGRIVSARSALGSLSPDRARLRLLSDADDGPDMVNSRIQRGTAISVPFALRQFIAPAPDGTGVAIVTPRADSPASARVDLVVVQLSGDTAISRSLRMPAEPITADAREAELRERGTSLPPGVRTELHDAARRRVPPIHSPIGAVLVGRDRSIWLRLRTTDSLQRWLALDATGQPVFIIALPAASTLDVRQVSLTHVWATDRRESGIKDIVRMRIRR